MNEIEPAESPWKREPRAYLRRPGYGIEPLDAHAEDGRFVVRWNNGKRVQITSKLHDLLSELDGESSTEEVALRLEARWKTPVTAADVEGVIDRFLKPHQLVRRTDETEDAPAGPPERTWAQRWRDRLLLQDFFFRFRLVPRPAVAAVANRTQILFTPTLVLAVVAGLVAMNWRIWTDVAQLRAAGQMGLTRPADYLLVFVLLLAGVLFHEFGHASAVARFGAVPDHIGFGLYFIYPAFFANVNESWRFNRRQRVVVDLAGIYFQVIATLVFVVGWLVTRDLPYLYAILLSQALAIYSLVPFFKFDGYWCLADSLGIPNLRKRAFNLLAHRWNRWTGRGGGELPSYLRLSRPVEVALLAYAVGSVAFFVFVLWSLARFAPTAFMEYPGFVRRSLEFLVASASSGLTSEAGVVLIRLVLRTFVLVGLCLILLSLGINVHDVTRRLAQRRS